MTAEVIPFNPLDKKNLGATVAEAMINGRLHPLGDLPEFKGAGIYAIYYKGDFLPYREIAARNTGGDAKAPIYVGKAVPPGARTGRAVSSNSNTRPLYSRLTEHAESVRAAENLRIEDFMCRFLVVDDIWIPLGESLLIARYSPVWNSLIDGFGNHDPGSGRYNGLCPRWDTLHPGRTWAFKCRKREESAADVARDVEAYLRVYDFPNSDRFVAFD